MNTNHAEDVAREHEEGRATAKGKRDEQTRAAQRIAALLAMAEDAAKRGDLAGRDQAMAKATGLQHKYAIDQILLEQQGKQASEEIVSAEFCAESNTPLIKAKRQLITCLASLYRGTAAMCSRWDPVKRKLDKRAYMQVWAHESDLAFIIQLYTSFILQMQTEMARDEKLAQHKITNAWRVSYAHAWVDRVYWRLLDLKHAQTQETRSTGTGAELVLASKADLVRKFAEQDAGGFTKGRRVPRSDKDANGRAAGDAAGRRADLGQKRTEHKTTPALD